MKRLILSAAVAALTLSPSLVRAEDSAAMIGICLESQYAMALSAIEREARDQGISAGLSEAVISAQIDPALDALAKSLEDGRMALAQSAERDVWEALNLAQNAFSGDDYVSHKIRRAIEVCLL